MIEKVRHRGKVENSRVLQSAAGFRRSQTADQDSLAVRWAIEIYRNLSQSGSLLYRLMAEAPKVPATDSANVDTISIWV